MQSRIGLGPVEMLAPKPRWAAGAAEQAELLDLVADRFVGHLVYKLAVEPLRRLHGFDERAINRRCSEKCSVISAATPDAWPH